MSCKFISLTVWIYWITSTTFSCLINNLINQIWMISFDLFLSTFFAVEDKFLRAMLSCIGCSRCCHYLSLPIWIILKAKTNSSSCTRFIHFDHLNHIWLKLYWFITLYFALSILNYLLSLLMISWAASLSLPKNLSWVRPSATSSSTTFFYHYLTLVETKLKTFIAVAIISIVGLRRLNIILIWSLAIISNIVFLQLNFCCSCRFSFVKALIRKLLINFIKVLPWW
jgi:hypothetical protein